MVFKHACHDLEGILHSEERARAFYVLIAVHLAPLFSLRGEATMFFNIGRKECG